MQISRANKVRKMCTFLTTSKVFSYSGFSINELPELSKGKGNKLLNIPTAAFTAGEESLIAVATHAEQDKLVIHAGQRHLTLKRSDLTNYLGERARRGRKLPRGFQKVDALTVERD